MQQILSEADYLCQYNNSIRKLNQINTLSHLNRILTPQGKISNSIHTNKSQFNNSMRSKSQTPDNEQFLNTQNSARQLNPETSSQQNKISNLIKTSQLEPISENENPQQNGKQHFDSGNITPRNQNNNNLSTTQQFQQQSYILPSGRNLESSQSQQILSSATNSLYQQIHTKNQVKENIYKKKKGKKKKKKQMFTTTHFLQIYDSNPLLTTRNNSVDRLTKQRLDFQNIQTPMDRLYVNYKTNQELSQIKESNIQLNSIVDHNMPFNYYRKSGVTLPWNQKMHSERELRIDNQLQSLKTVLENKINSKLKKYQKIDSNYSNINENSSQHSKSAYSKRSYFPAIPKIEKQ